MDLPRAEGRGFNISMESINYWKRRVSPEVQIQIRIEIHPSIESFANIVQEGLVLMGYRTWIAEPQGEETCNDEVDMRGRG